MDKPDSTNVMPQGNLQAAQQKGEASPVKRPQPPSGQQTDPVSGIDRTARDGQAQPLGKQD